MDEDDLHFMDAVLFDDDSHHNEILSNASSSPRTAAADGGKDRKKIAGSSSVGGDDLAGALVARALNDGRVPGFRNLKRGDAGVGGGASNASRPSGASRSPATIGVGVSWSPPDDKLDATTDPTTTVVTTSTTRKKKRFRPIFGAENRRCAVAVLGMLVKRISERGFWDAARWGAGSLSALVLGSDRRVPTNEETAFSAAALIGFSLVVLTVPSYAFVATAARTSALIVVAAMALFFDLEEVSAVVPTFFVDGIGRILRCVEGALLLGKDYVGRHWVEESSSGGAAVRAGARRHENLISRWSAKFGQSFGGRRLNEEEKILLFACLEKEREKVSGELGMTDESNGHVAAMNFCYAMLRGNKKGQRLKVREKFRKNVRSILAKVQEEKKESERRLREEEEAAKNKRVVELSLSKSGKIRRRRSLSWPPSEYHHSSEAGNEEVEVVFNGSVGRSKSKRILPDYAANDLFLETSSQDGVCGYLRQNNTSEGFEVIDPNERQSTKKVKFGSNVDRNPVGRKRRNSDPDVLRYTMAHRLLCGDNESRKKARDRSGDIFSVLSLSFDGADMDDSISSTSSLLAENQDRQLTEVKGAVSEEQELNWFDVGAKIGIRILNSEKVQQAMANPSPATKPQAISDSAEKDIISEEGDAEDKPLAWSPGKRAVGAEDRTFPSPRSPGKMDSRGIPSVVTPVPRPVHAIWTSPGAAASPDSHASNSTCLSENAELFAKLDSGNGKTEGKYIQNNQETYLQRLDNGAKASNRSPLAPIVPWVAMTPKNGSDLSQGKPCIPTLDPVVDKSNVDEPSIASPRAFTPESKARSAASPSASPGHGLKRRRIIPAGVKMVLPVCPLIPTGHASHARKRRIAHQSGPCHYQMATVVSSKRIFVPPSEPEAVIPAGSLRLDGYVHRRRAIHDKGNMRQQRNNCLSITVQLDKSLLRDGKFAEMTIRVMDEWTGRHVMPRHSKYPIGSCVASSFGVGVLVGWRVEDDCHVVSALWTRRGPGSALAYLNRDSLHGVVEAAVGFKVETTLGKGQVKAYVDAGPEFRRGKYFVFVKQRGRHQSKILEFSRSDILSCRAAKFVPVVEQIKESAKYQIQLHNYELALREQRLFAVGEIEWNNWSDGFEMIMSSFMRAVEEDEGVNKWLSSIISFLETLDFHGTLNHKKNELVLPENISPNIPKTSAPTKGSDGNVTKTGANGSDEGALPGLWLFDDLFGGVFSNGGHRQEDDVASDVSSVTNDTSLRSDFDTSTNESYAKAYAFINTVLRTVAIARASVSGQPNLQLGLGMFHESMIFIRTVIKVQERNMSPKSVKAWKRTFDDIIATFGPVKQRLAKLASGIAERLAEQGKIAKIRLIRFVDILMIDDLFLQSLQAGDWEETVNRIQLGLVRAGIVDRKTSQQYLKTAQFIYNNLAPRANRNKDAAARNKEKLSRFALALKWLASPQRSFLGLFTRDDVLEIIERLMVRVYQRDSDACNMLNICAFNFHSFRHLRIFNNMAISGKLWRHLLDAANEEFSWAVSRMPENAREFVEPISKLFSLGVARHCKIKANDLTSDWLDFLMEEEAVKVIQQLDLKLILNLESFCNDLKAVMVVLPYYSSLDDDILKLIDEVELENILKEASGALVDLDRFSHYVREKSAVAVKRFLEYLPKMSIPIERRELGEGWVLTCRGKLGGHLRLSDVCIEREFMTCNVIGSGNIFSPVDFLEDGFLSSPSWLSPSMSDGSFDDGEGNIEISVLDDVAGLIRNAQQHGSWQPGVGGVDQISNGRSVDPALDGLPVSKVLKCGIELWKNLEIDDEELMEIAIRDVSYQIQLQKEREEGTECVLKEKWTDLAKDASLEENRGVGSGDMSWLEKNVSVRSMHDPSLQHGRRFNPRKDPTVLFLEMKKVTCHLDEFLFRIEQKEASTIIDPVFEGVGSLTIKNLSIRLRVECRKERINKLETEVSVPVLHLQELDIQLEKLKIKFKDTGADWLLNKITRGFRDNITEVVETNVKEQIGNQIQVALENLNSFIEVNPDLMLKILGITIDDLEENVIWV